MRGIGLACIAILVAVCWYWTAPGPGDRWQRVAGLDAPSPSRSESELVDRPTGAPSNGAHASPSAGAAAEEVAAEAAATAPGDTRVREATAQVESPRAVRRVRIEVDSSPAVLSRLYRVVLTGPGFRHVGGEAILPQGLVVHGSVMFPGCEEPLVDLGEIPEGVTELRVRLADHLTPCRIELLPAEQGLDGKTILRLPGSSYSDDTLVFESGQSLWVPPGGAALGFERDGYPLASLHIRAPKAIVQFGPGAILCFEVLPHHLRTDADQPTGLALHYRGRRLANGDLVQDEAPRMPCVWCDAEGRRLTREVEYRDPESGEVRVLSQPVPSVLRLEEAGRVYARVSRPGEYGVNWQGVRTEGTRPTPGRTRARFERRYSSFTVRVEDLGTNPLLVPLP